jgi:hypothetical protein
MRAATVDEVERVTRHIERAEELATRRKTAGLNHLQRILRQLLLAELARYRAAGRFPINRDFAEQTPYFIDASGTRCAMAHLLEVGGEAALVDRIARERNNAWVRELADEPRLLAWLEAAGLTVDEAAAIQPSYCSAAYECICGGDFSYVDYPVPAVGVLEGTVGADGKMRVERTYGDPRGYQILDQVSLTATHAEGTHVLVPLTTAIPEGGEYGSVVLVDGIYDCTSQGVSSAPGLEASGFVAAVMSSDCDGTLESIDPAWREQPECEGPGETPFDNGGCSAGTDHSVAVGILLAVVATMVRRAR